MRSLIVLAVGAVSNPIMLPQPSVWGMDEGQIVELWNGTVYATMRTNLTKSCACRGAAVSTDKGVRSVQPGFNLTRSWSVGREQLGISPLRATHLSVVCAVLPGSWSAAYFQKELVDSGCQASILRAPRPGPGAARRVYFSNPADPKFRQRMTVRRSDDDASSWPLSMQVTSGPAAYSCLSNIPDSKATGAIGLLWESGTDNAS